MPKSQMPNRNDPGPVQMPLARPRRSRFPASDPPAWAMSKQYHMETEPSSPPLDGLPGPRSETLLAKDCARRPIGACSGALCIRPSRSCS